MTPDEAKLWNVLEETLSDLESCLEDGFVSCGKSEPGTTTAAAGVFTEGRKTCVGLRHDSSSGYDAHQFVNNCGKPLIIIACLETREFGWICTSGGGDHYGQPLVMPGKYTGIISDNAIGGSDTSWAAGCVPTKTAPSPSAVVPGTPGSVEGEPCFEAANRFIQARDAGTDSSRRNNENPSVTFKRLGLVYSGAN